MKHAKLYNCRDCGTVSSFQSNYDSCSSWPRQGGWSDTPGVMEQSGNTRCEIPHLENFSMSHDTVLSQICLIYQQRLTADLSASEPLSACLLSFTFNGR